MTCLAQSFGALVVADAKLETVRAASANLFALAGVEASSAVGEGVGAVVGFETVHLCRNALGYPFINEVGEVVAFTGANGRRLEAVVFASGAEAFLEIAYAAEEIKASNLLRRFAASLSHEVDPLTAVAEAARMICDCDEVVACYRGAASYGVARADLPNPVTTLAGEEARSVALLSDADAPLAKFYGDASHISAPLALALSHEPSLSGFASVMRAKGAIFAQCGDLFLIGWADQAIHVTPEASRIVSLAARLASSTMAGRALSA
ncbi:MAG: hypothetical protein AAFN79_12970 [Pseudomonadota bacterium]